MDICGTKAKQDAFGISVYIIEIYRNLYNDLLINTHSTMAHLYQIYNSAYSKFVDLFQ